MECFLTSFFSLFIFSVHLLQYAAVVHGLDVVDGTFCIPHAKYHLPEVQRRDTRQSQPDVGNQGKHIIKTSKCVIMYLNVTVDINISKCCFSRCTTLALVVRRILAKPK